MVTARPPPRSGGPFHPAGPSPTVALARPRIARDRSRRQVTREPRIVTHRVSASRAVVSAICASARRGEKEGRGKRETGRARSAPRGRGESEASSPHVSLSWHVAAVADMTLHRSIRRSGAEAANVHRVGGPRSRFSWRRENDLYRRSARVTTYLVALAFLAPSFHFSLSLSLYTYIYLYLSLARPSRAEVLSLRVRKARADLTDPARTLSR